MTEGALPLAISAPEFEASALAIDPSHSQVWPRLEKEAEMTVLKSIALLALVAGCASPIAGDFTRTSTMGAPAALGFLHSSDDENEDGVVEANRGSSVAAVDADMNEDGIEASNRGRSVSPVDADANEDGIEAANRGS